MSERPTDAELRKLAQQARAGAGRALGWLDPNRGPVDYQQALANAERVRDDAISLVEDLLLMTDQEEVTP